MTAPQSLAVTARSCVPNNLGALYLIEEIVSISAPPFDATVAAASIEVLQVNPVLLNLSVSTALKVNPLAPSSNFGKRYVSGARPKKSQKKVGTITVKGRTHSVFRGTSGGIYYKKGKAGNKI